MILKVLIIEDQPERQKILCDLYKDHAWVLVHTALRAVRLLELYDFDLITLDYDLAGEEKGDKVANTIQNSRNSSTQVFVHSMNDPGAKKIKEILPQAIIIPISKIVRNNITFKRLRDELKKGIDINWAKVFKKTDSS